MRIVNLGLGVERMDYHRAWTLQRDLHSDIAAGNGEPVVLLVEHPPVYTAGRRTTAAERPFDGTPVVDVDRGGKITWHGPGQLVGYPIVKLPEKVYVVDYVRRLEEALIRGLADFGLRTGRVPGRSGVWLAGEERRPERKIAAIGVRVARGTTMHGFAVNVDPDMSWFDNIVPCGIADAAVTSIAAEVDGPVPSLQQVADVMSPHLLQLFTFQDYVRSPDLAPPSSPNPVPVLGLTREVG